MNTKATAINEVVELGRKAKLASAFMQGASLLLEMSTETFHAEGVAGERSVQMALTVAREALAAKTKELDDALKVLRKASFALLDAHGADAVQAAIDEMRASNLLAEAHEAGVALL